MIGEYSKRSCSVGTRGGGGAVCSRGGARGGFGAGFGGGFLDWLARHVILPMIERVLWAGAFS